MSKTEITFIIDENKTKVTRIVPISKNEFLGQLQSNSNFKIPRNVVLRETKKEVINKKLDNSEYSQSESDDVKINSKFNSKPIVKSSKIKDDLDDSDLMESDEESEFDSKSIEFSEDDSDKAKKMANPNYAISSRRSRAQENLHFHIDILSNNKKKKPIKDMTEEEIIKKNDLIIKRRAEMKQKQEEEKKNAIDKILNDEGRKAKERQKKIYDSKVKKEKEANDKFKASLNKIKIKHTRDGLIYVRFPNGLLLPKVLCNKVEDHKYPLIPKCDNSTCLGKKRYQDPLTKLNFCSVACFKEIRSCKKLDN